MPKVLIADELQPRAAEIFAERGVEVDFRPGLQASRAARASSAATTAWPCARRPRSPPRCWPTPTKLKVVGRAGIGVDNIDVEAATARGVVVMNTPFGNSITTAEHAIALMFAVARQIPAADRSTQAGKWEKNRFMGIELSGKTLGVVGCGNIGSIVAERAHRPEDAGDRLRSRSCRPSAPQDLGVEKVDARRAPGARRLHHAAHAADRADPQHPVARQPDEDQAGVRLINCARGGLVDEQAVPTCSHGHIAGAGFDVFTDEPAKENAAVRRAQRRLHARISAPRPARRRRTWPCRSPSRSRTTC